jgi:hypothetical protein
LYEKENTLPPGRAKKTIIFSSTNWTGQAAFVELARNKAEDVFGRSGQPRLVHVNCNSVGRGEYLLVIVTPPLGGLKFIDPAKVNASFLHEKLRIVGMGVSSVESLEETLNGDSLDLISSDESRWKGVVGDIVRPTYVTLFELPAVCRSWRGKLNKAPLDVDNIADCPPIRIYVRDRLK